MRTTTPFPTQTLHNRGKLRRIRCRIKRRNRKVTELKIENDIESSSDNYHGVRTGWSGVRVPVGAGSFSLHHRVQPNGYWGLFPWK